MDRADSAASRPDPAQKRERPKKGLRETRFALGVAALLLIALALAGRSLGAPGLYYDEAVQARPALEFATGIVHASPLPGSQTVWLGNRRFPTMTQPYMGALKSQALIPTLWFADARVEALRLTTLLWALGGLILVAAFCRRAFGRSVTLVATALLCFDPSFLFLARHDWGSFSLSFMMRGAILYCGWRWWESRRPGWLWGAAFATGLAFYNKVDIAIFVSAVGLSLCAVAARPILAALREEGRAARTLAGAGGAFLLGLGPMIPALGSVVGARNAFAEPNEFAEKLNTLWTMADGSYFYRLMSTGGIFGAEPLGQVAQAPASLFPFALLLATGWTLVRVAGQPLDRDSRALGFFFLASALSILGVFLLPGAVRIHHAMNSYPLMHLLLAYALVDVVRAVGQGASKPNRRILAACLAAGIGLSVVVTQWSTYETTRESFLRTGGKGRWSSAIHDYARELNASGSGAVSSLDWGFHEPLALLANGRALREPHWQIPTAVRQRGGWLIVGEKGDQYVLHLAPYDRAGFGQPFLAAAESLESDEVIVEQRLDGVGDVAFVTVRIDSPHRIAFAGTPDGRGAFQIELLH
jgi:hypothetical protein